MSNKETAPKGAESKSPSLADRVDKLEKIVFARERMMGPISQSDLNAADAAEEAHKHRIVLPRDQAERNAIVAEVKAERHKKDKKAGRIYLPLVIATFFLTVATLVLAQNSRPLATDKHVLQGVEGEDASLLIRADEGDDVPDDFRLTMGADGIADISIGGTNEVNVTQVGLILTAQAYTITNTHAAGAFTITPTANLVLMSLTGNSPATGSFANATYSGQLLKVINSSTGSVVISDAANMQSTGALTLGQYDSAEFIGDMTGTNWIMLGTSNN